MKIWNEICLVFKGEQHLIEQGHRTFHSIFKDLSIVYEKCLALVSVRTDTGQSRNICARYYR